MEELAPGRAIGKYAVVRTLGEGGMATVVLVRHETLESLHALKVLTLNTGKALRERMLQEGRLQASLSHPNIVTVFDVLEVAGRPALLMEYVDGPSLELWLEEQEPSLDEVEAIFRGIVAGVGEAHAHGLVHRDLKPANVLLKQGPEGWVPKVTDFGLAKAWEEQELSQTRSGVPMGTPSYMAPEQIRDARNVDTRADLFGLGCLLYQMCTGRMAFDGPDLVTIFNAILAADYVPPTELVPDLPTRFQHAIVGALLPDRERRIATTADLLEVLEGQRSLGPNTLVPGAGALKVPRGARMGAVAASGALAGATLTLGAVAVAGLLGTGAWWALHASQADTVAEPAEAVAAPVQEAPEPEPTAVARDPSEAEVVEPAEAEAEAVDDAFAEVSEADEPAPAVQGRCPGPRGAVVGYANVRGVFVYRQGQDWMLFKDRVVYADYPHKDNGWRSDRSVVCRLRSGDRVRLARDPIKVKGAGFWVAVTPESVSTK